MGQEIRKKEERWKHLTHILNLLHSQHKKCGDHIEQKAWCEDCSCSICVICHLQENFSGHQMKLREMAESNLQHITNNAELLVPTLKKNESSLEMCIKSIKEVWFYVVFIFSDFQMNQTYETSLESVNQQFENLMHAIQSTRDKIVAKLHISMNTLGITTNNGVII
jgi:hypothetical protein